MTRSTTLTRTLAWLAAAAALTAFAFPAGMASSSQTTLPHRGLAALAAVQTPADEPFVGIAVLTDVPTRTQLDGMRSLGLTAQGMRNLPLAAMYGTQSQLMAAADITGVLDVYPDVTPLVHQSDESTAAIRADVTRGLGFTGQGVGVAIVDTGVDATHPSLEQRVVRNVKILSPEYLDILGVAVDPELAKNYLAVPVDQGPYNNADTSGHGTHVAGIAAGDGTEDPRLVGVAPEADVIGYGTGDIVFIFTIIAAFDDLLTTKDEYNIRVVNNSWGSSYRTFDPMEPTNVATKALHDAGVTVVFAAGNSESEMSVGPASTAPWVIGVGSTTTSKQRSSFSSGGLQYDNSRPEGPDENGHIRFVGDGLGLYAPDISAPGTNILGPGTPTGVGVLSPSEPGGTATLSGTSMAAPHVAGLVAVLLDANPDLTPAQIEQVLEVTAVPLADGTPYWHAGFGFVDAVDAVELVTQDDFSQAALDELHREAVAARLAARDHSVLVSDHFIHQPLPATAGGLDSRSWEFEVDGSADAIRASIAFGGDLGVVGINLLFDWGMEITDADGTLVLATELQNANGYAQVDLDEVAASLEDGETLDFGTWTATIIGYVSAEQPALLFGGPVSAAVMQLQEQVAATLGGGVVFEPSGELAMAASGTPDESVAVGSTQSTIASGGTGITSPEGCEYDDTVAPNGSLSVGGAGEACFAGQMGYATNYGPAGPATFTSAPLSHDVTIGGPASIVHYVIDSAQPLWTNAFSSAPTYALDAVDEDGNVTPIGAGDFAEPQVTGEVTRAEYTFEVPPTTVPAGSQLRLQFWYSGFYTSGMRMVYGGPDYADAGLRLTTGVLASSDTAPGEAPTPAPDPAPAPGLDEAPLPTTGGGLVLLGLTAMAVALLIRQRMRA
jgi:serine protease AprX